MIKAFLSPIRTLSLLLLINGLCSTIAKAQTPANCLEIESILVDACGSPEGENEMVRFKVGPTAIATSNLTVTWPNNSFLGISPVNSTTNNIVSALNGTILSCGYLLQPVGGMLPAGSEVLLITSTNVSLSANSFANLTDTLYVIFQNAGNTAGHFANYSTPSGLRTLAIGTVSPACGDAVTYDKVLLVNQSGGHGGSSAVNDGATVEFSWPGTPNYINNGCMAPFVQLTSDAGSSAAMCSSGTIALNGTASGNYTGVIWQGGHGTFSNPASLSTSYTGSAADAGSITLSLGVIGHCHDTVFSTVSITITPAPAAAITASGSTNFCAGGSVTLTASGGSSYSWSTGATTTAITASSAGTYTVTATNTCGTSTATQAVTVNPLPAATITPAGSTAICSGDSVTLNASGTGTFSWSTGSTAPSISVSAAGTYTLTATNSCGSAAAIQSITINPLPAATITPGGPTTFCAGGSVTLTASGGTSYAWSTGSTAASITVSAAGTYTLTATNSCGSSQATQLIGTTAAPAAAIHSAATSFCAGSNLELYATGSGSYTWSNGATTDSVNITSGGMYILTSSTTCGTASDTIIITQNPLPATAITAGGSTSLCNGDSVTLTASGGAGYMWSNGSTSSSITVSAAGTYTVTASNSCGSAAATQTVTLVTSPAAIISSAAGSFCAGSSLLLYAVGTGNYTWSNGATTDSVSITSGGMYILTSATTCGTASDTVVIIENPLPVAAITPAGSTMICSGSSVVLNGSGGTSYLWMPGGSTGSSIAAAAAGTYTLTATNTCGSDTATSTVILNSAPVAGISASGTTVICSGDEVTLNATGGSSYIWSGGQTGSSVTTGAAGIYTVIASNSCGADTASVTVTVDSVTAYFTASPSTGLYPLPVSFTNGSSASAIAYTWDFGDNTTGTTSSPGHTFQGPGTYTVTLTAANATGCSNTYTSTVTVLENPSVLEVPNIFTPNNDGINDVFAVRSEGISTFSCDIYDRWGIKMAALTTANSSWDGRTTAGAPATDGTYFYIVKAKGADGKVYDEKGCIQLIRK